MASPAEVRARFRSGAADGHTAALCSGYLQANVAILPAAHADAFEAFCIANFRPCPLVYRSEAPGQLHAGLLGPGADIRTDLPRYCVVRDGVVEREATDIRDLWEPDMVAFYLGCSFTFERALLEAGVGVRHTEEGCNVPMYVTDRQCRPVPPFSGNMVVSMRPVPPDQVEAASLASGTIVKAHGVPVHCGDPAALGITDLAKPDFGDAVTVKESEVPCFWACGVTALQALMGSKLPLCITHAPGCMFVCDVKEADVAQLPAKRPYRVSDTVEMKLQLLEQAIQADPGDRGIAFLHLHGELGRAAASLAEAKNVMVLTGFPCVEAEPFYESDGPPGALQLAASLHALGKKVTMYVEDYAVCLLEKARDAGGLPAIAVRPLATDLDCDSALEVGADQPVDHIVAIERAGPAEDGKPYTMRGRDMTDLCGPGSALFQTAERRGVTRVAIGDGGNELGMGKVKARVQKHIPMGDLIACDVGCDMLITAGVSNWGGYALGIATAVVAAADSPTADVLKAALPGVDCEEAVLRSCIAQGVLDGKLQQPGALSVDGFPFRPMHADLLNRLRRIALM